jgi:hypothetical protein
MSTVPQRASKEEVRARDHGLGGHMRCTLIEAAWIGDQGVCLLFRSTREAFRNARENRAVQRDRKRAA